MHEKLTAHRIKAPSIARFFAWPGAWMRNSVPRRAQQRAR
jgi:hypothetical protein